MQKKLVIMALMALISLEVYAVNADDLLGKWYTAEDKSICEVYKKGDTYEGKFLSFKDGDEIDSKNANATLRTRSLKGVIFISGFTFKKGAWENGKIYNPEDGKTYSCVIKFKEDGRLDVRGYVGTKAFGKTQVWRRVK